MKIENIRLGLATNSSSSHSIIFNLKAPSEDWEDAEFGWNEFCCNCKDSKKMYLAAVLLHNLTDQVGLDIGRIVVKAWLGIDVPMSEDGDYFYGIDHQSLMTLPVDSSGKVDKELFNDLVKAYMDPKIAIVGGNDNEEYTKFVSGRESHILPTDDYKGTHVCRKDPSSGHWVLFNRSNGTKIRLHFDDDAPEYTKAFAPELVDVKITDFCNNKPTCVYCYQDSHEQGKHADKETMYDIAYRLGKMGVFEVALGGGEPTAHPRFAEILRDFRYYGIVPNFTTRSHKWLHDDKIREAVKKYAGKFAVSITYAKDMVRAYHIADELEMANAHYNHDLSRYGCRMGFQYVMGSSNLDYFKDILEELPWNAELTLLGYKDAGRGSKWKPYDYSEWLDILKSIDISGSVGIDTSLATEFKDEVLQLVDERLVTFEEGKFSMYIDAVKKRAAPSSYCDESEYVDLVGKNDWQEVFAKF